MGRPEVSYGAALGCNWTLVYIEEQFWCVRQNGYRKPARKRGREQAWLQ